MLLVSFHYEMGVLPACMRQVIVFCVLGICLCPTATLGQGQSPQIQISTPSSSQTLINPPLRTHEYFHESPSHQIVWIKDNPAPFRSSPINGETLSSAASSFTLYSSSVSESTHPWLFSPVEEVNPYGSQFREDRLWKVQQMSRGVQNSVTVLEGNSKIYDIDLSAQPSSDVVVTITGLSSDLTLNITSLTFTPANWNSKQEVILTALHDSDDTDESVTLTLTGSDGNTQTINVTIIDDDRTWELIPEEILEGTRLGVGPIQLLKELGPPSADVTFTITGHSGTDIELLETSVTFLQNEWDQSQSITIIAKSDQDDVHDYVTLTFVADGGGYTGLTYTMDVMILERKGYEVYIDEGSSVTDGMYFSGPIPTLDPIVTYDWDKSSDIIISPHEVTYDADTWHSCNQGNCSNFETVTISSAHDSDDLDDRVVVTLRVTGPPGSIYFGINALMYVNINDIDDPGIDVDPSSLTIVEGNQDTFEVTLSDSPHGDFGGNDVTVNISSGGRTSATPSSLIFTTANWSQPQTVTVQTRDDSDFVDNKETIRLHASGGGFERESITVEVTIKDDDTPDIEISEPSISVTEGATNSFEVELEGEPNRDIEVIITGYVGTDLDTLASAPRELTFTPSDWDEPQIVTVGAKEDLDFDPDYEQLTLTTTGPPLKALFVTVNDNDRAEIIADSHVDIREGESTTIEFSLSSPPTSEVAVSISGYLGTDVEEPPPNPLQRTFDGTNWNAPQTITLTASEDDDSIDEDIILTLSAMGGGYDHVTLPVNVTIKDDDLIKGIDTDETIQMIEGTSVDLKVKLLADPPSTVTIIMDGYVGTDLGPSPPNPLNLEFDETNWNLNQTIVLTASEDDDFDEEDVIHLTLTASAVGQDDFIKQVGVKIRDNDHPSIVIDPASLNIHEGGANNVNVSITAKPFADMTIQIPPVGDLTARPSELTFANDSNWSNPRMVTLVAATDTDVFNDMETVVLSASGGGYNGLTSEISVEIIEDISPPSVLLSVTPNPITEGNSVQLTAILSKPMPADLVVNLIYEDMDTEPSDYAPLRNFNIDAGSLRGSGTLRILDDTTVEPNEEFRVSIRKPNGADLGDPSSMIITILDDGDKPPPVEVLLSVDPIRVFEGDQVTVTTTIQEALLQDVTIPLIYPSDGSTAIITQDYIPLSQLIIPAGQVTKSGTIQTIRDAEVETSETFTVAFGALPALVTGGRFLSKTITILDQQKPKVSLSVDHHSIEEGEEANIKVTLSSPLTNMVTIPLAVTPITASTSDYQLIRSLPQVEIRGGELEGQMTIRAIDDDFIEESETFAIEFGSLPSSVISGVNSIAEVIITDNDDPDVNVPTSITILEGNQETINISLTSIPSSEVEIQISTQQVTEIEIVPSSLLISPDQWNRLSEVNITAPQDENMMDEQMVLTMSANGGEYSDILHTLVVNIIDDDHAALVVQPSIIIDEGASAYFDVRLAQMPTADVTVTLSGYQGTDLVLQSSSLITFSESDWSAVKTVELMALEDSDAEQDDPVDLILSASGGGYDAIQEVVMVTIREKDTAGLIVTPRTIQIFEGDSGQLTVSLNSRPLSNVTVSVSGHQNTDVEIAPTTLTFTPTEWESIQTISIDAKEDMDTIDDPVILTFTASGGNYDGQQAVVDVMILDKGAPKISIYEGQASEEAGVVRLPLELSHGIDEVITVQYQTSDPLEGTIAIAGEDYTASRGIVIFDPGGTRGVVQFEITNDIIQEERENFTVILSSASTNAIIHRGSATATILDDDGGLPTIAIRDAVASQDAGLMTFQLHLSQPSPYSISVHYRTKDGTASAGKDYSAKSGTATFTPGTMQTSIDIPLLQKESSEDQQIFYVHLESSNSTQMDKDIAIAVIQKETEIAQNVMVAYTARFVRTLSVQLTEALQERLQPSGSSCSTVERVQTAQLWLTTSDWTPSLGELLSGCKVTKITAGSAGKLGVWGRGAFRRFQGQDEGSIMLRGDVSSAMIGADYQWKTGWMAGMMVAHSHGKGTFKVPDGDGAIETGLTGIYPYVSYQSSQWEIWMSGGYGWGNAEVQHLNGDLTSRFGAIGFKGNLASKRTSQLRYYGDVLLTDAHVNVTGLRAEVIRVRLGMESSFHMSDGIRPFLDANVRQDGGDVEKGTGLEIGGGVHVAYPQWNLRGEVRSQGLVLHSAAGFTEWGLSGSIQVGNPSKGFMIRIRPSWGPTHHRSFYRQQTILNATSLRSGMQRTEVELGYGFPVSVGTARSIVGVTQLSQGRLLRLGGELRPWNRISISASGLAHHHQESSFDMSMSIQGTLRY